MRRPCFLLSALGLAGLGSASCTFEDPNEPRQVPLDECIQEAEDGSAGGTIWYEVDGPVSNVPVDLDGNGVLGEFFTHYIGEAWTPQSTACRSSNLFFDATPTNAYAPYTPKVVEGAPLPPETTIGYCVINEDNPHEYIMYAASGTHVAGLGACETTLTQAADVTAQWLDCPGAPLCPEAPVDACFQRPGDGKAFGAFIDREDVACTSNPDLSDAHDTLLVSLGHEQGARFDAEIFGCLADNPWSESGPGLGRSAIRFARSGGSGEMGDFSTRAPEIDPSGALGYCLLNEGSRHNYAIFAMCADPVAPGPTPDAQQEAGTVGGADGGTTVPEGTPKEAPASMLDRLEQWCLDATRDPENPASLGHSTKAPARWFDCPGGPLCR